MPRRERSPLAYIFDKLIESSLGRIYWHTNMWAIIGSRWDKKRLVNENLIGSTRVNSKGEWESAEGTTLVKRLNTSNCPNPPGDDFYIDKEGRGWVPATECRKCPYHQPSQGRVRFPRCTYKAPADTKEAIEQGIESANSLVNTALNKALKFLE